VIYLSTNTKCWKVIRKLVTMLADPNNRDSDPIDPSQPSAGEKSKRQTDMVINMCAVMQNLRTDIVEARVKYLINVGAGMSKLAEASRTKGRSIITLCSLGELADRYLAIGLWPSAPHTSPSRQAPHPHLPTAFQAPPPPHSTSILRPPVSGPLLLSAGHQRLPARRVQR
jgi:hypothetical protein